MNTVKSRVMLIVEPTSEQAFATALADAEIGKIRGLTEKRVLILYDTKKAGESVTAPHLRLCPFQKSHCQKAIRAVLTSRGNDAELHDGDLFLMYDGGRYGPTCAFRGRDIS